MPFSKEDLLSQHYSWSDEISTAALSGGPSRRLFDRSNGYQVLFLINFFGSLSEKFTLNEGRQMEDLIVNHLPEEAKSEISVFNWLKGAL